MFTLTKLTTRIEISLPNWATRQIEVPQKLHTDADKMRLAIDLSRQNVLHETGGPFGAAIFRMEDGMLLSVGVNGVVPKCNSALHAEMMAIMLGENAFGSHTLGGTPEAGYELFTSCAPCAMCLGAILWSGVRRVVIGADRDDAMSIGFDEGPVFPESHDYLESRGISLCHNVLRNEAADVLRLYASRNGIIYNG